MIISTQAGNIFKRFGEEDSLKMLSNAGFKAMDYSITQNMVSWNEKPFQSPQSSDFKAYFEQKGVLVASHGISIIQTHAPYRRPFQSDSEGYKMVLQQCICAIYATALLKCPRIVCHPVTHPDFDNGQNTEKGLEANLKFFGKLVPALKETGVIVCIENLYRGELGKPKIANVCSDAESLSKLIDTLNEAHGPYFAACLDTGHALISGNDPVDTLKKLGHRVQALHIHDSHGVHDDHNLPGRGIIDWKSFMSTLFEIGYNGCFSFEADNYFEELIKPFYGKDVMQDALKLMHTVGNSMASSVNG